MHPIYQAIRDADSRAKSVKKGKRPVAVPRTITGDDRHPVRYPLRAFVQTWSELTNWWTHYDTETLARELTDEQFDSFLATAQGTIRFADELQAARHDPTERPHLRAL